MDKKNVIRTVAIPEEYNAVILKMKKMGLVNSRSEFIRNACEKLLEREKKILEKLKNF